MKIIAMLPTTRFSDDGECRDIGMLDGLQDYIDRQKGDILIVLHQMGNHGPRLLQALTRKNLNVSRRFVRPAIWVPVRLSRL